MSWPRLVILVMIWSMLQSELELLTLPPPVGVVPELSDEAVEWLLDFVARNVGDQPKSFHQLTDEKVQKVRKLAEAHGVLDVIDELIDATWGAQALYLMRLRRDDLDGKSILRCLKQPETAEKAAGVARTLVAEWKSQE